MEAKLNLIKDQPTLEVPKEIFRLRGGNDEARINATNETEKHDSAPTQPRGWGLTAEQTALYNSSLEEANSVEYEVMAFLQVSSHKHDLALSKTIE